MANASSIIVHPQYNLYTTYDYDAVLIKVSIFFYLISFLSYIFQLTKPLKTSSTIAPISLANVNPLTGSYVTVSGWGTSSAVR